MPGEDDNVTTEQLEGQINDLEAQVTDLTKKLETATGSNQRVVKAVELQAQINTLTKTVAELTEAKAEADEMAKAAKEDADRLEKALSELSEDELTFYKAFPSKDKKEEFLEMSEEDRKKSMKVAKSNDEEITVEGQVIRKSLVGEASFKILKAQAERIAKNEKDISDEIAKRETVELRKRADDEFKHVPGTVEERADMLRAIGKMDEKVRKSFEAVFTSAEKLSKAGFDRIGSGGGKETPPSIAKAAQDFSVKVAEIKKRDNCSGTEAMGKARREHPELFKATQTVEQEA